MTIPTLRRRALASVRRTLTPLFALAGMIGLAECTRDESTAPLARTAPPQPEAMTVTSLGTLSIGVPTPNQLSTASYAPLAGTWPTDGAQYFTNGVTIPANTAFRVRVHGTLAVTKAPGNHWANESDFTMLGTYGPGGANTSELLVQVSAFWGSNRYDLSFPGMQHGTSAPDSAVSSIYYYDHPVMVYAGRTGVWGGTTSSILNGHVTYDTLYQLVPQQTVDVEQLTDVVHIVADPVRFKFGQQVKFTMIRDDGSNQITNWWWQTDDGHSSAFRLCGQTSPCLYSPPGKGWMTLWTNIGFAQAYIVPYSSLTLEADPSNVNFGDSVTFTPKYDGVPGPAARWRFDPSDTSTHETKACGQGVSSCKKQMLVSGKMTVFTSAESGKGDSASAVVTVQTPTLYLRAQEKQGKPGRTVTFTPNWSDSADIAAATWTWAADTLPGSTSACAGSPVKCLAVINNAGTMTTHVVRLGVEFKMGVHVTMIPCPTGDSLLDTQAVRDGLSTLWSVTRTVGDPMGLHEMLGSIFEDRRTGEVTFAYNPDTLAGTPCSTDALFRPARPSWADLRALAHSHPHVQGTLLSSPCGNGSNSKVQQGISTGDIATAQEGWPVYAIDRDSIYRTDGHTKTQSWPRTLNGCAIVPNRRPGTKPIFPSLSLASLAPELAPQKTARIVSKPDRGKGL